MITRVKKQWRSLPLLGRLGLVGMLIFGMLFSVDVLAASSRNSENTQEIFPQGETIEGPGFFSGTLVRIDGIINGTAFVAGQNVEVNGTINGDLFIAGQNVIVTGDVTGNVYSVGMNIRMEGQIDQDTFMAGQTLTVVEDAALGRDLFAAGNTIFQEGQVQRHMYGAGESIVLSGTIGGNGDFSIHELTLQETAVINGDLVYQSDQEATVATGATVEGETDFERVEREPANRPDRYMMRRTFASRLIGMVWSLLSAVLIWFLIKYWRPTWWERTASPLRERPLAALGIGLVALFLAPLLIGLIMLTIIGIPLALILITVYGILLYLAKIIVSVFLAMWLNQRFHWTERNRSGWLVLLALLLLGLLGLVPVVNFIVGLLVAIAGMGAFILSHYQPRGTVPRTMDH